MRQFASDPPIEKRVGKALEESNDSVAVAESCTGGLVGSLITDVPGASAYFDRSLVTYSYAAKLEVLAVPRELLDEHGAVSERVAERMAAAVRDTAGVDWGLATTGIAGPSGGAAERPAGTVYVGVARRAEWGTRESTTTVSHYVFDGDRLTIKERIARQALKDLLARVKN